MTENGGDPQEVPGLQSVGPPFCLGFGQRSCTMRDDRGVIRREPPENIIEKKLQHLIVILVFI